MAGRHALKGQRLVVGRQMFIRLLVCFLVNVLAAALSLLLDPTHVEARVGLSLTALLTLVAMQFTMQTGLVEVAYLTLLDHIYLLSYH